MPVLYIYEIYSEQMVDFGMGGGGGGIIYFSNYIGKGIKIDRP